MNVEPTTPTALHRTWAAVGLGLLVAGLLVPLALAQPGVPSARSFVHHCTTAATPRLDGVWFLGAVCTAFVLYAGARASIAVRRVLRADRVVQRLHTVPLDVNGTVVLVVPGSRPTAFCGGLKAPRIYLSHGALQLLSADELRAVVAHEEHHVRRREPLRLAARNVLQHLLFFVPVLQPLDARLRVVEELRADQVAVRCSAGDRRPVASAMLRFDAAAPGTCVLAERVDALTGMPQRWRVPTRCGVRSAVQLAGIGLFGAILVVTAQQSQLVVLQACSLSSLGVAASAGTAARLARQVRSRSSWRRPHPTALGLRAD